MQTEKLFKNPLVVSISILGLSLIICAFLVYQAIQNLSQKDNTITVTGSAEKMVESDTAKWTISFTKRTEGLETSLASKELNDSEKALIAYLVSSGIEQKNISTKTVQNTEICELNNQGYENCSLGVRGYILTSVITVETSNVYKIADLSKNLSNQFPNVTFNNNSAEYYFNALKDIRVELLSEATKNAKERAQSVAKAGGASVGSIISLSSGVFQVTQKNSVEISDYGTYDTSTIEKKVTATVKVDFAVK